MANMIRKQIYIHHDSDQRLEAASKRLGLTESELIRRGLDNILSSNDHSQVGSMTFSPNEPMAKSLHESKRSTLTHRPRRLRKNPAIRKLVRETKVTADNLIMPLFVEEGSEIRRPITSMPGQFRYSIDELVKEAKKIAGLGIPGVLLFGIPSHKDDKASEAYKHDGIVQRAVSALKEKVPDLLVITDVCLCEYMDHGHCGVVTAGRKYSVRKNSTEKSSNWMIDNDASVELIAQTALSHAEAGADIVAPSDMMDGRVGAIRQILDGPNLQDVAILSYAAKYASAFYGPFREAAESTPAFGDRRSYQMDPANRMEAIREVGLDIDEGADIVMVKPGLPYLDIIRDIKETYNIPLAAYNVSGEYAMVKAAAEKGLINEKSVIQEMLVGLKRAGADILITYFASEIAPSL